MQGTFHNPRYTTRLSSCATDAVIMAAKGKTSYTRNRAGLPDRTFDQSCYYRHVIDKPARSAAIFNI